MDSGAIFARRCTEDQTMRTVFIRRVCALLTAAALLLGAVPVLGETYPLTAYTTAALRLRQQPNSSATVLLTIPGGDMVVITGESGSYYIAVYEGVQALTADDIARTIVWMAQQPAHVNINRIEMMPVAQSFAGLSVARR